jgi:glutamine synthetase
MMVNPRQKLRYDIMDSRQTVELRSPDGSANTHLLLAGMTTALLWAYRNPEAGLEEQLTDIATSCVETAELPNCRRTLS